MKEIIRDEKKFYELKEQDLIRLHTRLRLIYEYVDNIFMDYADFDPSTIASLAAIKNYAMEARDILKVTDGHYTIKKSSEGSMSYGDVEQRLETVKSSLEDAISDVDCTLSDRIDEQDEKIAEMYEFYENFPADWTLEKQLKELAEETVKNAIEPIMKRQTLLKMDIDSLRNDLKLWVSNDERTSAETEDRLTKLEKTVATLSLNVNNANVTANVACNNPKQNIHFNSLSPKEVEENLFDHEASLCDHEDRLSHLEEDIAKLEKAVTDIPKAMGKITAKMMDANMGDKGKDLKSFSVSLYWNYDDQGEDED